MSSIIHPIEGTSLSLYKFLEDVPLKLPMFSFIRLLEMPSILHYQNKKRYCIYLLTR
jgi:hypothetical protein